MRPLVTSGLRSVESFEFRRDSAGLGVPRQTMGNLDKISRETVSHGVTSTEVYVNVPEMRGGARAGAPGSELLGASVRRGSAPPPAFSSQLPSAGGGGGGRSSLPATSTSTAQAPPAAAHPSAPTSSGRPR
jgi:hypothetical protein